MAAPVLMITRPEPAATRFAEACAARFGSRVAVMRAPILRILPVARPEIGVGTLILTSENAVAVLGDLHGRRAYCVGPRTAEAAARAGATAIEAGGTADALVDRVLADAADALRQKAHDGASDMAQGATLWHLRGRHARGNIAQRLTKAGLSAREAVVYVQEAQDLSPTARSVLAAPRRVLLPLFSPRSARLVRAALPEPSPGLVPVALSAAVAEAFGSEMPIAHRPTADAMLKVLEGKIDP